MAVSDIKPHPLSSRSMAMEGHSYFVGRNINFGGLGVAAGDVLLAGPNVRSGDVQLISRVHFTSPASPETTNNRDIIVLKLFDDPFAGTARESMFIFCPAHNLGGSPLSARDHYSWVWEPKAPIVIPSNWRLTADWVAPVTFESPPISVLVYGARMDANEARTLGYDVSSASLQADRGWIQRGLAPTSDTTTNLIPVKAGYSVYISDVLMIASPAVANATVQLETSDGRDIFRWVTGALQGIPIIRHVKCNIYVDQASAGSPVTNGYGVQVTSTNMANRFSIVVLGRYVPTGDVPRNNWWSCVSPAIPTASQAPTLGRTVKARPGKGSQHVVEGYEVSMVRDHSSPLSINLFALTYGTTIPGGGNATNFTLGGNVLLSQAFSLFGRDEMLNTGLHDVMIEAAEDAAIFFESQGGTSGLGTPAAAGDIIDASLTVWGQTIDRKANRDFLQGA